MTDFTTTNVHAKSGAGLEDTVVGLLFRTGSLTTENRALRDDLGRLLAALGIDPATESVSDAVEVAQALMAFYADSLPNIP